MGDCRGVAGGRAPGGQAHAVAVERGQERQLRLPPRQRAERARRLLGDPLPAQEQRHGAARGRARRRAAHQRRRASHRPRRHRRRSRARRAGRARRGDLRRRSRREGRPPPRPAALWWRRPGDECHRCHPPRHGGHGGPPGPGCASGGGHPDLRRRAEGHRSHAGRHPGAGHRLHHRPPAGGVPCRAGASGDVVPRRSGPCPGRAAHRRGHAHRGAGLEPAATAPGGDRPRSRHRLRPVPHLPHTRGTAGRARPQGRRGGVGDARRRVHHLFGDHRHRRSGQSAACQLRPLPWSRAGAGHRHRRRAHRQPHAPARPSGPDRPGRLLALHPQAGPDVPQHLGSGRHPGGGPIRCGTLAIGVVVFGGPPWPPRLLPGRLRGADGERHE